MTKDHILSYLNSSRKPLQEDPKQSWIGSYNIRQLIFYTFFNGFTTRMNQITKRGQYLSV